MPSRWRWTVGLVVSALGGCELEGEASSILGWAVRLSVRRGTNGIPTDIQISEGHNDAMTKLLDLESDS